MLQITGKSAWFMAHRIRHAMKQTPFGGKLGGIVGTDETYIGGKAHNMRPLSVKSPVFALVERGGHVRSITMPCERQESKPITVEPGAHDFNSNSACPPYPTVQSMIVIGH